MENISRPPNQPILERETANIACWESETLEESLTRRSRKVCVAGQKLDCLKRNSRRGIEYPHRYSDYQR